ncbi:MAG: tetratricopeptide repeat protein [Fimbriimonas sp.]
MPASLEATKTNLPQQITTFVGRDKEVAEVHRMLSGHKLVTLLGSGGTGKTRLALEVASQCLENYPDGVWYVDLSPLADPLLVPQAFATALGLHEEPGKTLVETVVSHLRSKDALLIVDNAEHVIEQAHQLCATILTEAPAVQMLAAGRKVLGLPAERTFKVPSLSMPDPKANYSPKKLEEFEAVRLFIDRATKSDPEFQVSRENGRLVARLCHQLDGIPYAIELAAAMTCAMPLEELSAKVGERFLALTDGGASFLPRTQTLRAMIGWSYEQLGEYEQKLLRRLSVFVNGCRLEATVAVCCDEAGGGMQEIDVEDFLETLVERAFLQYDEATCRYRMLETVRTFARDALDETIESDAIRERHLCYFRDLVRQAEPLLNGSEAKTCLAQLDEEQENLRAAMEWGCKGGDRQVAMDLAVGLSTYYQVRSMFEEGCATYGSLLKGVEDEPNSYVADSYAAEGVLLFRQGQFGLTRQRVGRALNIYQEIGDRHGTAKALNTLAVVALQLKELETAGPLFERALVIFREIGEERRVAMTLNNLGILSVHLGQTEKAKQLYEEALEVNRRSGNRRFEAGNLTNLADLALREGAADRARELARRACQLHLELGDRQNLQDTFEALAAAELMCGRPYVAALLFANKEALMAELGTVVAPFVAEEYRKNVDAARRALGEETFRAAFTEGRSMTSEEAFKASLEDF